MTPKWRMEPHGQLWNSTNTRVLGYVLWTEYWRHDKKKSHILAALEHIPALFGTCFISPYLGNNYPNWRTHIFERGPVNHQQLERHHCHTAMMAVARCECSVTLRFHDLVSDWWLVLYIQGVARQIAKLVIVLQELWFMVHITSYNYNSCGLWTIL